MSSQNENIWFKEGLRFRCTECGKCCTGAPGVVWVTVEEIEKMAEYLQVPLDDFAASYVRIINGAYALKEDCKNFDCVFLKKNKCSIYPVRPKQCKTFPWWQTNLKSEKAWQEAAKRCEGINHPLAEVIPLDEIAKQYSIHSSSQPDSSSSDIPEC